MRCTLRRQTAGVAAEATLRIVDDERTVQTREDGVPNESVVPLFSREQRPQARLVEHGDAERLRLLELAACGLARDEVVRLL